MEDEVADVAEGAAVAGEVVGAGAAVFGAAFAGLDFGGDGFVAGVEEAGEVEEASAMSAPEDGPRPGGLVGAGAGGVEVEGLELGGGLCFGEEPAHGVGLFVMGYLLLGWVSVGEGVEKRKTRIRKTKKDGAGLFFNAEAPVS